MRANQYNPNQAGFDTLKACQIWRKGLNANISPFASLEERTVRLVEIAKMDYNELRAACVALPQ